MGKHQQRRTLQNWKEEWRNVQIAFDNNFGWLKSVYQQWFEGLLANVVYYLVKYVSSEINCFVSYVWSIYNVFIICVYSSNEFIHTWLKSTIVYNELCTYIEDNAYNDPFLHKLTSTMSVCRYRYIYIMGEFWNTLHMTGTPWPVYQYISLSFKFIKKLRTRGVLSLNLWCV